MRLEGQKLSAALEDFLPDYEFAFEGNGGEVGGMYYHTDRTRQLNARFGDMLHKIQDLEVGCKAPAASCHGSIKKLTSTGTSS